ncbi:hypothetical protein HC256_004190 [Beauveria bassiana]|nr:hypothetical protein HC256_006645 [Beauveria bassiana]KAH8715364.1 hypothetical protein HC256_004190 [Beauveria bassiana]
MPAAHQTKITEPAGDGTLNRRSSETNAKMHGGKRKNSASTRPTPSKVTIDTGAACWDCAKMGHTCKPVPAGAIAAVRVFWRLNRQIRDTNGQPDDAWRNAAQYAAQQLRACGAAPSAAALSVPAIASRAESPEKTFKERKTLALEALADAARLWIRLNKPESEGEGDDAGEADEEDD